MLWQMTKTEKTMRILIVNEEDAFHSNMSHCLLSHVIDFTVTITNVARKKFILSPHLGTTDKIQQCVCN